MWTGMCKGLVGKRSCTSKGVLRVGTLSVTMAATWCGDVMTNSTRTPNTHTHTHTLTPLHELPLPPPHLHKRPTRARRWGRRGGPSRAAGEGCSSRLQALLGARSPNPSCQEAERRLRRPGLGRERAASQGPHKGDAGEARSAPGRARAKAGTRRSLWPGR